MYVLHVNDRMNIYEDVKGLDHRNINYCDVHRCRYVWNGLRYCLHICLYGWDPHNSTCNCNCNCQVALGIPYIPYTLDTNQKVLSSLNPSFSILDTSLFLGDFWTSSVSPRTMSFAVKRPTCWFRILVPVCFIADSLRHGSSDIRTETYPVEIPF